MLVVENTVENAVINKTRANKGDINDKTVTFTLASDKKLNSHQKVQKHLHIC